MTETWLQPVFDDSLPLLEDDDCHTHVTDTSVARSTLDGESYACLLPELNNRPITILRDPMLGTGGLLWPAAERLASYLCQQGRKDASIFKGKRVLELGAGTGLVGIALLLAGLIDQTTGASYTASDLEAVLPLIQRNYEVNGVIGHVLGLPWGTRPKSEYDVVLLADCVYLESLFQPLLDTLLSVVPSSRVKCFLAIKYRRKADKRFIKMCRRHFNLSDIESGKGQRAASDAIDRGPAARTPVSGSASSHAALEAGVQLWELVRHEPNRSTVG
ncbi:Protein-lysine N-methyltransferase efm6 [Savitreella phatthalungensis]